jgi:hypothetical protein
MRRLITFAALAVGLVLAGCDSFDPIDKFQDMDIMGSAKPPIRGERREVFPSGVPGVAQGVPPDLVKGYQPPVEAPPPVIEAKQPKAKQKQKKTATAAPRKQARPKPAPQQQTEEEAPQPARTQAVRGGAPTQQMPGAQPTWPAGAQPAPQR